jgi:hypothetical protein
LRTQTRRSIGFGVARTQHPLGVIEPLEIFPTPLGVDLAFRLALVPVGYFGTSPHAPHQTAIDWRLIEGLVELCLLFLREDERATSIVVAAVAQALRYRLSMVSMLT